MNFYDINEVQLKLQKIYNSGDIFKDYLEVKDIFPIVIKFKKVQEKDIQGGFSLLLNKIKTLKQSNLPIEYQQFNFKRLGTQTLPICVKIKNIKEYCSIMGNQHYVDKFIKYYQKVITKYPMLKDMIEKRPMLILEYSDQWDKLFLVIDYLKDNKNPNIYIREICLEDIDTKYIEKNIKILDMLLSNILNVEQLKSISDFAFEKRYNLKYPLAQVRFRILDDAIQIQGIDDLTLCIDKFEQLNLKCEKVFVVENKITFLSFPSIKNSIVIFGSGYGVGVLKNTAWLNDVCIYYWGDIDIDGMAILSQFRGYFPKVKSIFMDKETLKRYKNKTTTYKNKKQRYPKLDNLTIEEEILYEDIIYDKYSENFRLEQELLPYDYIVKGIKNV